MCLAIPMRIHTLHTGSRAVAELDGFLMNIGIELVPEVSPGDYVLVHAGFALEVIGQHAAEHLRSDLLALSGYDVPLQEHQRSVSPSSSGSITSH